MGTAQSMAAAFPASGALRMLAEFAQLAKSTALITAKLGNEPKTAVEAKYTLAIAFLQDANEKMAQLLESLTVDDKDSSAMFDPTTDLLLDRLRWICEQLQKVG